ncbi:MAG: hypothetical protein IKZ44_09230 [Clostridia bacterium]|nr:hypothetical protein [Clostridia bacterium]
MLGQILIPFFVIFFGAIAVLGIVGIVMIRRKKLQNTRDDAENAVDLNDRFNRARYMNEDGE